MCGTDCAKILTECWEGCCNWRSYKQILPWFKMLRKECGRNVFLCLLISFISLVAMIIYVGIYTSLVLNNPNIICVPVPLLNWYNRMSFTLIIFFSTMPFAIRRGFGKEVTYADWRLGCILIPLLGSAAFLGTFTSYPLFGIEGAIIKDNNGSHIMFQYFGDELAPEAFPIFRSNDIDSVYINSTCNLVLFSSLCPVLGPVRNTSDLSGGVFRCRPKDVNGLEPFLHHLKPHLVVARTATNLGIVSFVFFTLGYLSLVVSRLSSLSGQQLFSLVLSRLSPLLDQQFWNRCCPSFCRKPKRKLD
jgi:hypothetical protein